MRAVLLVAVLSLFLVGYFALVRGSDDQPTAPNTSRHNAAAVIDQLVAFARSPTTARASALPLAGEVELGLANRLMKRRSADELSDPDAWELDAKLFRAGVGPFSALRLLAEERGRLTVSVGPHRHCVSPPVPPPPRVASLRRVSVQPRDFQSCLQWFTVDLFLTSGGEIRAITLDLFEP